LIIYLSKLYHYDNRWQMCFVLFWLLNVWKVCQLMSSWPYLRIGLQSTYM